MSLTLRRVAVVASAAGTAVVLATNPAGAAGNASVTSTPHAADKAAAAPGGRAAAVDAPTVGDVTGAASAAVGFRISGATCYSNAVTFTADTYETGFSGVQRFRQRAQLQEFTTAGWVARTPISSVTSTRFPNNGSSFHFSRDWNAAHVADGASWRVVWQGFYLNGFGGTIAKTRPINVNCL